MIFTLSSRVVVPQQWCSALRCTCGGYSRLPVPAEHTVNKYYMKAEMRENIHVKSSWSAVKGESLKIGGKIILPFLQNVTDVLEQVERTCAGPLRAGPRQQLAVLFSTNCHDLL